MTASDGTVITDYSNHMIARAFGAMYDKSHGDNKRIGVSVDDIADNLQNNDIKVLKKGIKKFIGPKSYAVVNKDDSIVTVVPNK